MGSVRYPPPVFDSVVAWGIGGLAVLVAIAWVVTWSRGRPRRRVGLALGTAAVMTGGAEAANRGLLSVFGPVAPPMAMMIALVFIIAGGLGLSRFGRSIAAEVPTAALIGLQAFRLPLATTRGT